MLAVVRDIAVTIRPPLAAIRAATALGRKHLHHDCQGKCSEHAAEGTRDAARSEQEREAAGRPARRRACKQAGRNDDVNKSPRSADQ